MKWFTSDWHLGHEAILKLDNRPFENLFEMQKTIADNINDSVLEDDILYVIGDVAYRTFNMQASLVERFLDSMNVKRKILIIGNHDKMLWENYIDCGFESIHTSLELDDHVLIHDSSVAGCFKDKKFICGHSHNLFKKCNNVVNVGCSCWNYKPVKFDEIHQLFYETGVYGLINVK